LVLAQQLGARRFETEALVLRAELHRRAGRRAQALADAEGAVEISRETSIAFLGPFALVLSGQRPSQALMGRHVEDRVAGRAEPDRSGSRRGEDNRGIVSRSELEPCPSPRDRCLADSPLEQAGLELAAPPD
jgi:hypothetical protein